MDEDGGMEREKGGSGREKNSQGFAQVCVGLLQEMQFSSHSQLQIPKQRTQLHSQLVYKVYIIVTLHS